MCVYLTVEMQWEDNKLTSPVSQRVTIIDTLYSGEFFFKHETWMAYRLHKEPIGLHGTAAGLIG